MDVKKQPCNLNSLESHLILPTLHLVAKMFRSFNFSRNFKKVYYADFVQFVIDWLIGIFKRFALYQVALKK